MSESVPNAVEAFDAAKFYSEIRTQMYGVDWQQDATTNHEHVEALEATVKAAIRALRPNIENTAAKWANEAAEDIESWAGYASTYFQEKHDLAGTLKKWRDRALSAPSATQPNIDPMNNPAYLRQAWEECADKWRAEIAAREDAEAQRDELAAELRRLRSAIERHSGKNRRDDDGISAPLVREPSAIEAPSDVERMLGAALTDALQQDFEGCEELARGVKIEFVGGEPVVRLQSLADFYSSRMASVDRGTK